MSKDVNEMSKEELLFKLNFLENKYNKLLHIFTEQTDYINHLEVDRDYLAKELEAFKAKNNEK